MRCTHAPLRDIAAVRSRPPHLRPDRHAGARHPAGGRSIDGAGPQVAPGGPLGYQWQCQPTAFCRPDEWGRLVFRAGSTPRVEALLQHHGVQVRRTDNRRYSDVHTPDPEALAGEAPYQDLLLALQRHPLGQIVPRQPRETPDILASICRAFPKARIVAAVATKRQARFLWRHLQTHVPGTTVRLVTGGARTQAGRVSVCTYPRIVR